MLHRSGIALLVAVASCLLPGLALAGTLDEIKKSGEFRIGYRTDAPPLAFNDASGQAAGYSVDLCKRIATAVKDHLKLADLKITFVPLTSADRLEAIIKNKADIECGATTITLSREEKVDFTLMTFVTGGSLLSLAGANVNGLQDVAGKSVAVVTGTTSQAALTRRPDQEPDRCQGGRRCHPRGGDETARRQAGRCVRLRPDRPDRADHPVGRSEEIQPGTELFSYEPYAFVVRRNDADFRLVANRALAQVYRTGQIEQLYGRWFGQAGIKPSPVLTAMYGLQSLPE